MRTTDFSYILSNASNTRNESATTKDNDHIDIAKLERIAPSRMVGAVSSSKWLDI
jgi:hypothetical protein